MRRVGGRGGSAANELSRNASLACEVLSWRPITAAATALSALLGQITEDTELNVVTILVTGSTGHLGEALMPTPSAPSIGLRAASTSSHRHSPIPSLIGDRNFISACMRGVRAVIHAATLHKPHMATHSKRDFVDINILGTLALLEEAVAAAVEAFIFTSTTSAFGAALTPAAGEPAVWVTEEVAPIPRNIYGVTKVAAEGLCQLFFRERRLPVIVLRTSRFFPEADDDDAISAVAVGTCWAPLTSSRRTARVWPSERSAAT